VEVGERARTGIDGLDAILGGGLPIHHLYLIQGEPGNGKTTVAIQFLLEGAKNGESCLYINLSESEAELRDVAQSHGWTLDKIRLFELKPTAHLGDPDADYTLLHPSEVDLAQSMKTILEEIDRVKPTRVVIDSLSEIRTLAQDRLRYRRQILMLREYFAGKHMTVLALDDRVAKDDDYQLLTVAHGVITLQKQTPIYGPAKRRMCISKLRGLGFPDGYHDYRIATGGIVVFPSLTATRTHATPRPEPVSSGHPALDSLVGGGLDRGSSTLLVGPAGVGKSTIAGQYVAAALKRGEPCVLFCFDESLTTFYQRSRALGIDVEGFANGGLLTASAIDPAELSPGEFANIVRKHAENGARLVVVDSLNGYLNAMPEEQYLVMQMHELLTMLGRHGVVTLLIAAQHGILGPSMGTPVDLSYLADNVLLLRYFEAEGRVRKAISALKKRGGAHETTIRELAMGREGLSFGPPLAEFRGVLTGVPTYVGNANPLLGADGVGN
jgi:circadian clock protein KaiC